MKRNRITAAAFIAVLVGLSYAATLLWSQTSVSSSTTKAAIVGKVAISSSETTLTAYCGKTSAFLFKGYVAFDSSNTGAANVIKATIAGASNVTAAAGSVKEWSCVNSDTVIISGAATDYINIMGEEVKANQGVSYD